MKSHISEIRKVYISQFYDKLSIWIPTLYLSLKLSSNKAKLACMLLNNYSAKIYFSDRDMAAEARLIIDGMCVEVEVTDELCKILSRLASIKRRFSKPIFEKLAQLTNNIEDFNRELAPYILERVLEGKT